MSIAKRTYPPNTVSSFLCVDFETIREEGQVPIFWSEFWSPNHSSKSSCHQGLTQALATAQPLTLCCSILFVTHVFYVTLIFVMCQCILSEDILSCWFQEHFLAHSFYKFFSVFKLVSNVLFYDVHLFNIPNAISFVYFA